MSSAEPRFLRRTPRAPFASIPRNCWLCRDVGICWKAPLRIRRWIANNSPTLGSVPPTCWHYKTLLPHCERLMLASRRASSLCMVVFPAAPSFRCRRVATTRFQPFGKGKRISPTPQGQRTLLHVDSKDIWSRKNVFAVSLMFYNANVKIISLRGKRDFRLTWQSAGKQPY